MKNTTFFPTELEDAARVLRAVNNDTRRQLLDLLSRQGKMTVNVIYHILNVEQSICSQHLAILRKEGIVEFEKKAKNRYYYIVDARLEEIIACAKAMAKPGNYGRSSTSGEIPY